MTDDDLDLELDETPRPRKPAPTPEPVSTATSPEAATAKPSGQTPAGKVPATDGPKVAGVPKPGIFQRVTDQVSTHRPTWNWKTFLLIFVALVVLVAFAENWAPVRFYFFGLRLEMPKALAFLLNAVIGAFLMWFWLRRAAGDGESGK